VAESRLVWASAGSVIWFFVNCWKTDFPLHAKQKVVEFVFCGKSTESENNVA